MKQAILMNIGNFHTEIAICKGNCINIKETLQTKLLIKKIPSSEILQNNQELPCVAACVVPLVKAELQNSLLLNSIYWVTADLELGINFSRVDKSTLGADRIANAVAAIHEFSLPSIILDCGTAITTEVIDAQKRFLGGSITPGRYLARWSLSAGTGQLPITPYSVEVPEAIGRNTQDAIKSGVDLGLLGAVNMVLNQARHSIAAPNIEAIAVGGDRYFFAENLDQVQLGPDHFTLKGLAIIAERL